MDTPTRLDTGGPTQIDSLSRPRTRREDIPFEPPTKQFPASLDARYAVKDVFKASGAEADLFRVVDRKTSATAF